MGRAMMPMTIETASLMAMKISIVRQLESVPDDEELHSALMA